MIKRMVYSVFMKVGMVLAGLYTNGIKRKPKQVYSNSNQNISVIEKTYYVYMDLHYLYCIEISLLPLWFQACIPLKTFSRQLFPLRG